MIKHLKPRPWWQIYLNRFLNLFKKKEKPYVGRLINWDLLSVSPMQAPTGQLFYLDYVYTRDASTILTEGKKGER